MLQSIVACESGCLLRVLCVVVFAQGMSINFLQVKDIRAVVQNKKAKDNIYSTSYPVGLPEVRSGQFITVAPSLDLL